MHRNPVQYVIAAALLLSPAVSFHEGAREPLAAQDHSATVHLACANDGRIQELTDKQRVVLETGACASEFARR